MKARYSRRLADLPWHNVPVIVELHPRKFRCRNQFCPQKVFCERFEKLAAPFARRTNRLAQVIELLAFSLGARPGARAAADMFFPVGKDVFLRVARKAHHQPETVRSWQQHWGQVIPMFSFVPEIRKAIHTMNTIESLHMTLRKVIKNRAMFPSDEAVFKILYLALRNIAKRWTMPIQNWSGAMNQFALLFENRLPNSGCQNNSFTQLF